MQRKNKKKDGKIPRDSEAGKQSNMIPLVGEDDRDRLLDLSGLESPTEAESVGVCESSSEDNSGVCTSAEAGTRSLKSTTCSSTSSILIDIHYSVDT